MLGCARRLRSEHGNWGRTGPFAKRVEQTTSILLDNLGIKAERLIAVCDDMAVEDALAYVGRLRTARGRPRFGWSSLTPTESRVVALAAQGLTNAGIAKQLLMGPETVKTHLGRAFTKTGVKRRAGLAAAAHAAGFIPPDHDASAAPSGTRRTP